MMKWNKLISTCLVLCLLALSGCGSKEVVTDEIIELMEPVNSEVGWITEEVIRRNLYVANVYVASVFPEVEEYAYEVRQTFDRYEAMLGDVVEKGDALITADTETLDTQIENLEERLATLKEDYEEYKTDIMEVIADKESYFDYYEEIFENLTEQEPAETNTAEHDKWQKEWVKWTGERDKNELDWWVATEGLRQKTEIYELDYAHYSKQLKDLKAQRYQAILRTEIDGEIVGIGMYSPTMSISADSPVVAVADMDNLSVKCEYIPKRNIMFYAKEIYAFINGVRYEVVYDDNGATDCTTFLFADENPDVKVGDYAVIVMETNSREQVIAVPKNALYVDASGHYVYVVENGETVQKPVKIGGSDGVYTEIVSGLDEGEEILISEKVEAVETATLEKGDFFRSITKSGPLYYPVEFYFENTIEYGTVFFQEFLVEKYQYVEAGQPIVRVRVEGDTVELARMENELQRAKERYNDLMALVTEENAESYADRIEKEQEAIAEQEEALSKLKADYATVEICAPRSGVVMAFSDCSKEQIIKSEAILGWMADTSYGYLALEKVKDLRYGDELNISYTNSSRKKSTSTAQVVSMTTPGVSATFSSEIVYARIPEEVLAEMLEVLKNQGGRYNMSKIQATAETNFMGNVVMVPKEAVKVVDGVTYVNVLQEDGSVIPMGFLSGGYDSKYYWVIEGLTEGMTICWE